jgi:hypothetical protein
VYGSDGGLRTARQVDCRTCGTYVVSLMMDAVIETFDRTSRYRLSGITRTASEEGRVIEVTTESARALLNETPELGPLDQERLILQYIEKHSRPPGTPVPLDRSKDYSLAHALGPDPFQFVVNGLASADLIYRTDKSAVPHYRLTRKGYEALAEHRASPVNTVANARSEFESLTPQQRSLVSALADAHSTGLYHSEFVASATFGTGWFLLLSPLDSTEQSKEIAGFGETDLHALRARGFLTLLHRGDFYVGSLTRKGQDAPPHSAVVVPTGSEGPLASTPDQAGTIPASPPSSDASTGRLTTVPSLAIGSTLGRYEILEELGHGGMGIVYKARHKELDDFVALKTLAGSALGDPKYVSRFWAEIKIALRVSHPLVCRIYECGEDGGVCYFTMELIGGITLKRHMAQNGPFKAEEAVAIAIEIAQGLQALHDQGIVHRDLKSSNVMRDDRGHVRLMDFGIAKETDAAVTHTASDSLIGSLEYMSPEYLQSRKVSPRSDLYSFGILLYELLVGVPPFQGQPGHIIAQHLGSPPPLDTPQAVGIPAALRTVIARCMAKSPDQRYATASELAAVLKGLDTTTTTTATLPSPGRSIVADAQIRRALRTNILVAMYEAQAFGANYVVGHEIATLEARRVGAADEEARIAQEYLVERKWVEYKAGGPEARLTVDGVDEAERRLLEPYGP